MKTHEYTLAKSIFENVSKTITSNKIAKQFILEELDAASQGDETAIEFVKSSGFKKEEYKDAMKNSFNEVDGANGPQQTLLKSCMILGDMDLVVKTRILVTEMIIEKYKNDEYDLKS